MRKDYDIVGSYDNQRVSTISAERTINMFEYLDPNGKKPKALLPTSGLKNSNLDFAPETGGSRATFVFNNAIYQVFGSSVYRITGSTGNLVYSKLGDLSNSTGFVGVDANTTQVIFVDGQRGYIYDTVHTGTLGGFREITDDGFPTNPIDVCFLDGFFVVASANTNNFYLCSNNEGMVWSSISQVFTANTVTNTIDFGVGFTTNNYATGVPITFVDGGGGLPNPLAANTTYYAIKVDGQNIGIALTQADAFNDIKINLTTAGGANNRCVNTGQLQVGAITSHPGTIVSCRTLHRRLFLFSQNYTEVWENAGVGVNLPFRRNNSLLMEVGTPSVGSVAVGFDRMFFLSQDRDGLGSVMEVRGTESIPVSNRALDYQLAQYISTTGVADARGMLIKENGLIFYRLNFTSSDHTFVLGVSMSTPDSVKWHEEETLNGNRHPGQTHAFFGGVNYYGDYSQAKFYEVDTNYVTNDGEAIRRQRIGRQMTPEGYNRLRIDRFHLDLLQGKVPTQVYDEAYLDAESSDDLLAEDEDLLLLDQQVLISGAQPDVYLRFSKDGGQTYGNYLTSTMGKLGERTYRTVWRKLGTTPRGQGFTPSIEFFSDIEFVVLGAAWDFEVMPE